MQRRFIMVTVILAMACITWLFGKNGALKQLLENSRVQDAIHVDRIFDLEQENADLMEYIMTLETDNSILSSCCEGGGMAVDTNSIY